MNLDYQLDQNIEQIDNWLLANQNKFHHIVSVGSGHGRLEKHISNLLNKPVICIDPNSYD